MYKGLILSATYGVNIVCSDPETCYLCLEIMLSDGWSTMQYFKEDKKIKDILYEFLDTHYNNYTVNKLVHCVVEVLPHPTDKTAAPLGIRRPYSNNKFIMNDNIRLEQMVI